MGTVLPRAAWLTGLVAVLASTSPAQSNEPAGTGSITIPDSLFQPIQLPPVLAYGYPPNDIHVPRFVEMIRNRDFDGLERELGALQAQVKRDVKHEIRFADAFQAAYRNDSAVLAGIEAWIAAKPQSAHARVARANYHYASAWRRRGTDYIRNTPAENIRAMTDFATRAIEDAAAALQLDSTHLIAYEIAIGVTRLAGRHDDASRILERGLATHRGSFSLYRAFMLMLWPRWGGSEQLMVQFGEQAARNADINPRLEALRGAVFQSRAFDSTLAGNHAGAVRELNKALRYGYERGYLRDRGKAYFRLGAYEYAFNDLRAAVVERSQDPEMLEYYGRTLVELATRARDAIRPTILARAIEVLRLAVYLEPDNTRSRAALTRAERMSGR